MSDQIILTGVRGTGFHGVFDFERAQGQEFVIDVTLELATRAAAASDDLADTVDYGTVANSVHERITGQPVDLIETLAELVAADCLSFAAVERVTVTVHKPQAPIEVPFGDVAIRIVRSKGDVGRE